MRTSSLLELIVRNGRYIYIYIGTLSVHLLTFGKISPFVHFFSTRQKKKHNSCFRVSFCTLGLNQVFISRFFWILTADVVLFFPVQKRRIFRHPLLLRAYKREWERERERERLSIVTSRRKRHREINYTYGKKESSFRLQRKSEREKKRDPKFIHSFVVR